MRVHWQMMPEASCKLIVCQSNLVLTLTRAHVVRRKISSQLYESILRERLPIHKLLRDVALARNRAAAQQ